MSKFIIKISFLLLLLIPSLSWVEEYDNLEGKIIDCYYNEIQFRGGYYYRHIIKFKKIERIYLRDGSGTWYNEYRAEVTTLYYGEKSERFYLSEGIIQYKNGLEWIWFDRPRDYQSIPLDKKYYTKNVGPNIYELRINRQTLKPELSKYTIDDDSFCKIIDEKGADSRILYLKKLYNDYKNTQNENELKEKEQLKKNQKI